jgi:preprotein translocase subunit SecG
MYGFVIGLIIVLCVLLVLVILAQNSKGGGLSSQFGGSSASNIIGVKQTGNLLEKLTWSFIIAIMALTLSTDFLDQNIEQQDSLTKKAGQQTPAAAPQQSLPTLPTDGTVQDSVE